MKYQELHSAIFKDSVNLLKEVAYAAGEDVFVQQEQCFTVRIYIHGMLRYMDDAEALLADRQETALRFGQWISEPVLWLIWYYRGTLTAMKTSIMLELTVKEFQSWMAEDSSSLSLASAFAQQHAR